LHRKAGERTKENSPASQKGKGYFSSRLGHFKNNLIIIKKYNEFDKDKKICYAKNAGRRREEHRRFK